MARTRGSAAPTDSSSSEIEKALKAISKTYGENTVTTARENIQPNRISTGVFLVDLALLGGIPDNRMSMLIGERSSGKTTMSNFIAASAQAMYEGQKPVVIDVEGTWDSTWGEKCGIDLDNMYLARPDTGEQAVDMAAALCSTKETSLVIIDSLAAMTPMKELDLSAEDATVGLQARLIGNMIRRVNSCLISERKRGHYVTVLFINQFRSKIGISWGDPRSIPGGKALEFATSVQLEIKNKETVEKDAHDVESVEYNTHTFMVKKNKLNNGLRSGEFEIRRVAHEEYGLPEAAVDDVATMLSYAKKFGVYTGAGSSWRLAFRDIDYTFRGAEHAIVSIYQDPDLRWALRQHLIQTEAIHRGMPSDFIERFE